MDSELQKALDQEPYAYAHSIELGHNGSQEGGQAILEAARKVANAERIWICEYPEFGDEACLVRHMPASTRQPRKHEACRWVLAISEAPDGQ